jgi:hypothetical protein
MLHVVLILAILSVPIKTDFLSNETLLEMENLNGLPYSHESEVTGLEAVFRFKISDTNYAVNELNIVSYYFSTTFIGEEHHEKRTPLGNITNDEINYHGELKMINLEEEANYLVCVFFINSSGHLIGSSRFCYIVSVSGDCRLEEANATFGNRQVYVLLPLVAFILVFTVLFSCIRDYIRRPRTIEAILKTLPQHHATRLESLAPDADQRRRRRTEPTLNNRLRQDSVLTIDYNHNADDEYYNYHGIDNASLGTIQE